MSSTPVREIEPHTALRRSNDVAPKGVCFKIFIVATIVLATIVVVTGILALMVCKGALPSKMTSVASLYVIGEVNSYGMLGGGIALFVLGILAWSCHLKKENQLELSSFK
ncbi:MAG TPA: hypothetical protein VIH61_04365 [Waddliaceae bacterium]